MSADRAITTIQVRAETIEAGDTVLDGGEWFVVGRTFISHRPDYDREVQLWDKHRPDALVPRMKPQRLDLITIQSAASVVAGNEQTESNQ